MRDLDEIFGTLDAIPAPDVHADAQRRLVQTEHPTPPLRGGRGNRAVVIAVAFLVFAAAAAYAWRTVGSTGSAPANSVTPPAVADPLGSIPVGWTKLPQAPHEGQGAASVWAGTELIEWGGYRYDETTKTSTYFADGSAFDPMTQRWSPIPSAPQGRADAVPLWTGTEALFLFGSDRHQTYRNGFAFDPTTGSWRTIAPAPIDPPVTVAVWTGSEVIVWGGKSKDGHTTDARGAAYDPKTNTWRRIADAPLSLNLASGVWTGDRLIVFGSLLDNRNHASTPTSVGAIYDPASDRWTPLPPSELSPQATSAVWIGGRMLAWDYVLHSQEYDPAKDRWTDPIRMPLQAGECYPDSTVVSGYVFAWYCGQAATYDVASNRWSKVRGGLLQPTIEANGNRYQLWRFATLIPAGDVIFFNAEGITVGNGGTPCYGCSGSPTSFWVFRPR